MNFRKISVSFVILLFSAAQLMADEGMWIANPDDKTSKAVVSLDFACTGSIISNQGLIITNHHCAYADVYALSTTDKNYLEDGYWAMKSSEEIPIPGKKIQMLTRTIDVTDEVNALLSEAKAKGETLGSRKLSYIVEKKYKASTGLEAALYNMWAGSKYYLALYKEFKDIRLVASPPVSIAAFGGDIDNWEWPQQKCDFALYRIYVSPDGQAAEYSAENVPLVTPDKLSVSLAGLRPDDRTDVYGYPGVTDRYCSAAELKYKMDVSLPIPVETRGRQMKIISSWMNRDPEIRLKYSDHYFSLSNVQELKAGELLCYDKFNVLASKEAEARELAEWIAASPERTEKWGTLLSDLETTYAAVAQPERNTITFRECLIHGSKIDLVAMRLASHSKMARQMMEKEYAALDLRVERDLFRYSLETFYSRVDAKCWGEFQRELQARYKGDFDAMCAYLWDGSVLTDLKKVEHFIHSDQKIDDDLLYRFLSEVKIVTYNKAVQDAENGKTIVSLNRAYAQALYQMRLDKGIEQYPDANSSMRISRGKVSKFLNSFDGNRYKWCSTPKQILQKENPDQYDFSLKPQWSALLRKADFGRYAKGRPMCVDFITDNDITGGNSGSPVVNAKGELVGLAFDGNKESLASDSYYVKDFNKCVCVDIRFVMWTLDKYAGLQWVLDEIDFK